MGDISHSNQHSTWTVLTLCLTSIYLNKPISVCKSLSHNCFCRNPNRMNWCQEPFQEEGPKEHTKRQLNLISSHLANNEPCHPRQLQMEPGTFWWRYYQNIPPGSLGEFAKGLDSTSHCSVPGFGEKWGGKYQGRSGWLSINHCSR